MIYINDIPSFRAPESEDLIIDDRTEKIELIGGNVVQSYGHIESGDVFSLECIFSAFNYNRLKALWLADERVMYIDEDGDVHTNLRVVLRHRRRVPKFPKYFILIFELWKV